MHKSSENSGFLMIETIIAIAVTAIFSLTFMTVVTYGLKANRLGLERTTAELYLVELIEIAKDLEQSNWEALASDACIDTECHFEADSVDGGNVWMPRTGSEELEDGTYERSFVVTNVDDQRLELEAEITWSYQGEPRTMKLETVLHNI